jgi:GWxTD domain-containing protein
MNLRVMVVVVALGALSAAPGAAAQGPEDRAYLEGLRAELAGVPDSATLLAREAAGIVRARAHRDSTILHLELGFLAYRLGEVTGSRRHYDDAAGEFEWAAEQRPDWPYPWYGLGLAELALGEHPAIAIENVRQALGKDFLSKAAGAFARAAAADPSFAQPVIDLADAARRQRVRQRLDVAQAALRAAAATPAGRIPALQLARGRIEREMGSGDSALAAFAAYLDVGGDRGLGLLERARTLFYLRQPDEAHQTYLDGAAAPLSAEARAEYRADLLWILTPDERTALDAVPDAAFGEWLERFWAGRDAQDARATGERLAEHHRRYFYAWRHFRLMSRHRRYTNEPFRSDQELVDDRGVIYIRHGEPDDRARFVAQGDPTRDLTVEPNESWLYLWPEGRRVFHFVARGDVQDYKLVESLADVFGDQAIAWQAAGWLPPIVRDLYDSRAALDPEYQRLARSSTAQGTALANERRAGRLAVRLGTTTDSYPLRFDAPLQSRIQLYAVGSPDGDARALLVFAVPGTRLVGRASAGGMQYPLEIRVAGSGVRLDTVRVFRTGPRLEAGQLLSGVLEVPLPSDTHTLRVALLEPGGVGGDVIEVRDFVVPDFQAGGLVLSDLVLGDRTSGLQWIVSGDTVPLSPRGAYAEGGAAELYYELHGLPAGTPYRARIEVRGRQGGSIFARIGRLFGGGPPVAFSFEAVTSATPHRARQAVGLAPLKPGDYVLSLTVEDPDGGVRRERDVPLRVVGR